MKQAARRPRPPLPSAASGSKGGNHVDIHIERFQRRGHFFHQTHVGDGIAHQAADQELERQIVNPLATRHVHIACGLHPAINDAVTQRQNGCSQPVMRLGSFGILADGIHQFVDDFRRKCAAIQQDFTSVHRGFYRVFGHEVPRFKSIRFTPLCPSFCRLSKKVARICSRAHVHYDDCRSTRGWLQCSHAPGAWVRRID